MPDNLNKAIAQCHTICLGALKGVSGVPYARFDALQRKGSIELAIAKLDREEELSHQQAFEALLMYDFYHDAFEKTDDLFSEARVGEGMFFSGTPFLAHASSVPLRKVNGKSDSAWLELSVAFQGKDGYTAKLLPKVGDLLKAQANYLAGDRSSAYDPQSFGNDEKCMPYLPLLKATFGAPKQLFGIYANLARLSDMIGLSSFYTASVLLSMASVANIYKKHGGIPIPDAKLLTEQSVLTCMKALSAGNQEGGDADAMPAMLPYTLSNTSIDYLQKGEADTTEGDPTSLLMTTIKRLGASSVMKRPIHSLLGKIMWFKGRASFEAYIGKTFCFMVHSFFPEQLKKLDGVEKTSNGDLEWAKALVEAGSACLVGPIQDDAKRDRYAMDFGRFWRAFGCTFVTGFTAMGLFAVPQSQTLFDEDASSDGPSNGSESDASAGPSVDASVTDNQSREDLMHPNDSYVQSDQSLTLQDMFQADAALEVDLGGMRTAAEDTDNDSQWGEMLDAEAGFSSSELQSRQDPQRPQENWQSTAFNVFAKANETLNSWYDVAETYVSNLITHDPDTSAESTHSIQPVGHGTEINTDGALGNQTVQYDTDDEETFHDALTSHEKPAHQNTTTILDRLACDNEGYPSSGEINRARRANDTSSDDSENIKPPQRAKSRKLFPWLSTVACVLGMIAAAVLAVMVFGSNPMLVPVAGLATASGYLLGLSPLFLKVAMVAMAFVGGVALPVWLHTLWYSRSLRCKLGTATYLLRNCFSALALGALATVVVAFVPGAAALPALAFVLKSMPFAAPVYNALLAAAAFAAPPAALGGLFWLGGGVRAFGAWLFGRGAVSLKSDETFHGGALDLEPFNDASQILAQRRQHKPLPVLAETMIDGALSVGDDWLGQANTAEGGRLQS